MIEDGTHLVEIRKILTEIMLGIETRMR